MNNVMLDLQSKDIIYLYLTIKTTRKLSEIGIKYFKDKYKKVFDKRYLTSICNKYSDLSAILKDGQIGLHDDNNGNIELNKNERFISCSIGSSHVLGLTTDGIIIEFIRYEDQILKNYGIKNQGNFITCSSTDMNSLGLTKDGYIIPILRMYSSEKYQFSEMHQGSFISCATGTYHSLGLTNDGVIIACRLNIIIDYGQCDVPIEYQGTFIACDAEAHYSLGLTKEGYIISWGRTPYSFMNVINDLLDQYQGTFIACSAGRNHIVGLTKFGEIIAWGNSISNDLVKFKSKERFISCSAGYHNDTFGLTEDGFIRCWKNTEEINLKLDEYQGNFKVNN